MAKAREHPYDVNTISGAGSNTARMDSPQFSPDVAIRCKPGGKIVHSMRCYWRGRAEMISASVTFFGPGKSGEDTGRSKGSRQNAPKGAHTRGKSISSISALDCKT